VIRPLTDAERLSFVATARERLGTPFRHQGRSERGLDCGGLLAFSLRAVGREPNDTIGYGRVPYKATLRAVMVDNFGDPVPKDQMREGDVALMDFGGEARHVGIITNHPLGGFAILHAYAVNKKVVEHRMDAKWIQDIKEVFRP
jgi:cell wall-associated NlpC family hydrolase